MRFRAPLPQCVLRILLRPEWFKDQKIFSKTRILVIRLPWLVRRPPRAVTLGNTIVFTRQEYFRLHEPYGLAVLAHELWHVYQYHRGGRLKFTAKYLQEWAPLALRRRNIYEHLSYEKEALAFQNHVEKELRKEFAQNGGKGPCLSEGGEFKTNPEYRLAPVEPFALL